MLLLRPSTVSAGGVSTPPTENNKQTKDLFHIPAHINLRRTISDSGIILFVAVVYFFAAKIGLTFFEAVNGFASFVWPASGIALAAVLLKGYRVAPGIFLGALLANFTNGAPLLSAFGIGIGNALEAVVATYLLRHILHFENFNKQWGVLGYFFFAGCLAPTIAATIGVGSLWFAGLLPSATLGAGWRAWWIGDMIGIIFITPIILLWCDQRKSSFSPYKSWGRSLETVAVSTLFLFTLAHSFTNLFSSYMTSGIAHPYSSFIFLPLSWIALRFGTRTTILATFLTATVALVDAIQGWGPFADPDPHIRLFQMEIFTLMLVATMLLLVTTVAQARRKEEDLSDQGETFKEAQSLSQTGSWELHNGDLVWSDELYRIYGLSPQEEKISRDTFIDRAHTEDRSAVRRAIHDALDRHHMIDMYHRIIRSDGTVRYLHAIAKPISRKDHPQKIIGVSKDITERRVAELELEAKTAELKRVLCELQRSDKAKTHFLTVLSHELRNPLAPILSAVELLQLRGKTDPKTMAPINIITRQVTNIKALLGDLLDLSRIEQGKSYLRKAMIDIREVIAHAIETATPMIENRKHRLHISVPEAPLLIYADALRLEQVVVNLMHNASKFSDPEGTISLSCVDDDKYISISISDNGIGIEPQFLEKIFEPFADFERAASSRRGGLGIGLKLVKALVELHGGTVEARSEGLGRGSEFIIRLPKEDPRDAERGGRAKKRACARKHLAQNKRSECKQECPVEDTCCG